MLQRELPLIYAAMTKSVLSSKSQPLILVDLLQLDDTLSQQGKTCLQEMMMDTALAYAGASWQVQ